MSRDPSSVPAALLNNLRHNRVLHGTVRVLAVETVEVPRVPPAQVVGLGAQVRIRTRVGGRPRPRGG